MNLLSFQPVLVEGSSTTRWMACIDGQPLPALAASFEQANDFDVKGGYGGVISRSPSEDVHFNLREFALSNPLFKRTGDRSAILLECTCGVEGCWPLVASVLVSGSTVYWDEFSQPHRPERDYADFGPYAFDLEQYVQAIMSVTQSTSRRKG